MDLFLIYAPVVSLKTDFFKDNIIELLPINMFEISKNYL